MIKRAKIIVRGIVQGVGFRPFIHKTISELSINGFVRNASFGAEIEAEGEEDSIEKLINEIKFNPPFLALIAGVEVTYEDELKYYTSFEIVKSNDLKENNTLISPDVCLCDDCLKELFSPGKRYRYPFINCTNCGPRFTITKDIPYDRDKTTMRDFKMCDICYSEYTDIRDRRYHAEPTGCNDCGPVQFFLDCDGNEIPGDPIEITKEYLRNNKIVAIKGLGGFHLACKIDNPEIPKLLRSRKHRDEKAFAIMCKNVDEAKKLCKVSDEEEKILTNFRRPIVLLEKLDKNSYLEVSENSRIGIMLPYTPVHFMLFEDDLDALIMTSANISDMPIIFKNDEAVSSLKGIADGFLVSNRDIHARCDDSVTFVLNGEEYLVRRSRGYVPYPIITNNNLNSILALGAEQKASFSLSKGSYVIPSAHIGDLKNIETFENYENQISHFERLYSIKPNALVCDMHPDYLSTRYGEELSEKENIKLFKVQHHHAHMASCMADNDLDEKVIGITWDGVGYGTDGNSWGGEFLVGDYETFERASHIRYIKLPGGDKCTKELWRTGISLLIDAGIDPTTIFDKEKCDVINKQLELGLNTPLSSGMGRLFDGITAILKIKEVASYEGQGPMLLEAIAVDDETGSYEYDVDDDTEIDTRKIITSIVTDLNKGVSVSIIASRFLNTLIEMAVKVSKIISEKYKINKVVLSGGTFNNMYIMKRLPCKLEENGLKCYYHHRVSTGDEGLSLGQLMIANKALEK